MPDLVVVVGPSGEETHTVANARDLVLHVPGYSYGNGKKASPVDSSPYAVLTPPTGTPDPARAVLDRYGSGSDALAPQTPAAPVVFRAPDMVSPVTAVEAAPVEAPAPAEEPEPAPAEPAEDATPESAGDDTPANKPERQRRAPKAAAEKAED